MQHRKTASVYALLALAWLLIAGWQGLEHGRFKRNAREALLDRAREIGSTLGVVIRSQGRFGVIRQSRLEAALSELAASNELQAVMLLNSGGQVVASAGHPVDLRPEDLPKQGPRWGRSLVTIVDLVDLGTNAQNETTSTSTPMTIVLNEDHLPRRRPPAGEGDERRSPGFPPPPGRGGDDRRRPGFPPSPPPPWMSEAMTTETKALFQAARSDPNSTSAQAVQRFRREFEQQRFQHRAARFIRPPWMNEEHYQKLLDKQGLHGFVLQLSMAAYQAATLHDIWIRFTTVLIALLAASGLGVAWRNMDRMNRLQIRLLRASEMNAHLQELNIAAAGLAHETRNPLNIVRGLAQLIAQTAEQGGEIRQKAGQITGEVDRITGRLNEFINYSRSPEPRPLPTSIQAVLGDVRRALESDLAEKSIAFELRGPDLMVEADESLLRQVIFNLLLNATQSVAQGGRVTATTQGNSHGEASCTISDDGPGVPDGLREEIYKPYFTTRTEGTGLGLAVVRQIVLAHHWEIEYVSSEGGGAAFRISGLKVIPPAPRANKV